MATIQYKIKKIPYMLLFFICGCDSYLDVNVNPNNPTDQDITLPYRLSAALYYTAYEEVLPLNQLGSFWAGYWGPNIDGTNIYKKEQLYNGSAIAAKRDGIPIWEKGYTCLNYYSLLKKQADTELANIYRGIARIMLAWHFMRLVDTYSDVPFEEALQPDIYQRPKYDDGQHVYKQAIDMITEGIVLLKATPLGEKPGKDDIMFGGDPKKWIKFANTIKLRALLRQSESNQEDYISQELLVIKNEGSGFLTETAFVQPGFNGTNSNPFWSTYYRNTSNKTTTEYKNIRPTQFIIDSYEELDDPRLERLYVKNKEGKYRGVIFGYNGTDPMYNSINTSSFKGPAENGGKPAAILKSLTQPIPLLGVFECSFLQTEAVYRGWLDGNVGEFYKNAIIESLTYMEVPQTEIKTYLENPKVSFNNELEQIIHQKWLALNSINGFEAWCDFRRLRIPKIPNSQSVPSPDLYPRRLLYPETESQTNIVEVSKKNITDITSFGVWWDKK